MKSLVALLLASAGAGGWMRAADATTPVDYTQRDSTFAPGTSTVSPSKQAPKKDEIVQDKRVEKTTIDKKLAPVGDRRSPLEIKETRDKNVREKDSHRPEKIDEPASSFSHQLAAISTKDNTSKPPTVAKYQDSLTSASASNMARFPAVDHATSAKINRFVFRKNPTETSAITNGASVTPAAGGGALQK